LVCTLVRGLTTVLVTLLVIAGFPRPRAQSVKQL
jgi:hypothetical protein